jgi:hypothetical protein
MSILNDPYCSWINDLYKRSNIKNLDKDKSCDWLIVGAGYTGLSAARKLSELHPNQKIIIVDAQLAGEGGSGRNSGYLVDTTLNDGFTSNKELLNYKKKTTLIFCRNLSMYLFVVPTVYTAINYGCRVVRIL